MSEHLPPYSRDEARAYFAESLPESYTALYGRGLVAEVEELEADNARLRAALEEADTIIRADQRTPINRLYDAAVVVRVALGIVNPHER